MNAIHADKFPSKPKHLYLGRYGWYYTGGPETAWMRGAVYLTQCRTWAVAASIIGAPGMFCIRMLPAYRNAETKQARDRLALELWRIRIRNRSARP